MVLWCVVVTVGVGRSLFSFCVLILRACVSFVVVCWSRCLLCGVCCLSRVVRCLFVAVGLETVDRCRMLFVVRRVLSGVCCRSRVVVACCLLCVGRCAAFEIRCALLLVWCVRCVAVGVARCSLLFGVWWFVLFGGV